MEVTTVGGDPNFVDVGLIERMDGFSDRDFSFVFGHKKYPPPKTAGIRGLKFAMP